MIEPLQNLRFYCVPMLLCLVPALQDAERPTSTVESQVAGTQDASKPVQDELAQLRAQHAKQRREWFLQERTYLERIDDLTAALDSEREMRAKRELEWLTFTRALSSLRAEDLVGVPAFLAAGLAPDPAVLAAQETAALLHETQLREGRRALRELRALLMKEQVLGLDLLELGWMHVALEAQPEGAAAPAPTYLGPIVVRLLDDRGRPMGTLSAERLRLECSRAGRSVTLIFEDGSESHGGVRRPFGEPLSEDGLSGGVRRIHLDGVDPLPWISALPSMFGASHQRPLEDDGRWDVVRVRLELNRLLSQTSRGGMWRLTGYEGVVDGELCGVHMVEQGLRGQVARRLFADRLLIHAGAAGVQLLLEDGVHERDGRRAPFLEGRYRIFLPGAKVEDWVSARMPGLVEAPLSKPDGKEGSETNPGGERGARG